MLHRPFQSLTNHAKGKLSPRYPGPFQVLERIGTVPYRLNLPEGARIHDVFHVGVLKPFHGAPPATQQHLPPIKNGRLLPQPDRVLGSNDHRGSWHVLVQCANMPKSEATWEPVEAFRAEYPTFQLEDELFVNGGRNVVRVYKRREPGGWLRSKSTTT